MVLYKSVYYYYYYYYYYYLTLGKYYYFILSYYCIIIIMLKLVIHQKLSEIKKNTQMSNAVDSNNKQTMSVAVKT